MTARRNIAILIGFVLSASLLSASVTAALLERYYGHAYVQTLGQICEGVIEHLTDSLAGSATYLPNNEQEANRQTALFQTEQAVLNALGGAIGFALAIVLFAGIRERIADNDTPKAFDGFPMALLTAGLMSIAFLGFSGLIK